MPKYLLLAEKDKDVQIASVGDNQDKRLTYRRWCGRYHKAMREGFYFEALLIDYALIEDALRSYLYHIGLIAERSSRNACKKAWPLRRVVQAYVPENGGRLGIVTITGKLSIVRAALLWHGDVGKGQVEEPYLSALVKQYEDRINAASFLDVLDRIDAWRKYRNEVMHGLMNKNLAALDERIVEQCEEGMVLARELQAQVKNVKYGNRIRRIMKLPVR